MNEDYKLVRATLLDFFEPPPVPHDQALWWALTPLNSPVEAAVGGALLDFFDRA